MTIEIQPETEKLVREEIRSGHFESVDDLILAGLRAWREQNFSPTEGMQLAPLSEFFSKSPLVGLELVLERDADSTRDVGL